jgi:hypothetical protein
MARSAAPQYLEGLVFFLGLAAVILAAAAVGDWYVRRKLEQWARTHGLRLLDQEDYRVVVVDAAGRRRSGWLLYTSRWRGLGPQKVEIRWDEPA